MIEPTDAPATYGDVAGASVDSPAVVAEMRRERERVRDADIRFYTALGLMLEESVRGLVREWKP